ncbi:hypothetical protein NYZ99_11920 [Maribacter litopenaei]|uniref:Uncharacterized protein n=1 Tax=Maribacter litopenaei TaxID=2976127 RepID=A0ABY5Y4P8_9FLAO|nr:hypothetical protein [Maribacter litopenaei]UWX53838.1 hypothetical protein NYZ99_11920 [Maribacter litopenaei]
MKTKLTLTIAAISTTLLGVAQEPDWEKMYKESRKTEVYEPVPPKVTPGKKSSEAPSDAIVLFDGSDLEK